MLKLQNVGVAFEVGGARYELSERQATILAENLRVLSKSEFAPASEPAALLTVEPEWRPAAEGLADSIEAALVDGEDGPLLLEGGAADATYCVLRLMAGLDANGGAGLRDALGGPVEEANPPERPPGDEAPRHLARPELLELLVILFILAVLTIVAGIAWTDTWWVLAPVIAALLGLRVAHNSGIRPVRLVGRLGDLVGDLPRTRGRTRDADSAPRRCRHPQLSAAVAASSPRPTIDAQPVASRDHAPKPSSRPRWTVAAGGLRADA